MSETTKRPVGRPPLPEGKKPKAITVRVSKKHHAKFLKIAKKCGSQRKAQEHMIDNASLK